MKLPARLFRVLVALVIAGASYFAGYRPLQINWGATEAEIARPLPGDDIVRQPLFNATRAMTIAAPPERLWPWVAQIGGPEVGWYSYDVIDHGGRESTARVVPGREHARGELVRFGEDRNKGFSVADLREGEWMLYTVGNGGMSWVFSLAPLDERHTRLVTRIRARGSSASPLVLAAVDVGDFVMLRQMLNGIRDRAEGRPIRSLRSQTAEFCLWVVCFLGFVVAEVRVILRRRWIPPAIVAVDAAALTIALVVCQPPIWVDAVGAAAILGVLVWDWGGRLLPRLGARTADAGR